MILPNFLIIGVQKAATTWLARSLGEHPEIYIPEEKELHFFNRHYARGLRWYSSCFSGWSGERLIGEATPGYIYFPSIPARILHDLKKQIRLIVSLRHPVDRAYSEYWMLFSRGGLGNDVGFEQYFWENRAQMRTRGFYFQQLRRYFERFPRERLHILLYENIQDDSREALRSCFEFLEVEAEFRSLSQSKRVNPSRDIPIFNVQAWRLRYLLRRLPRPIEVVLTRAGKAVIQIFPRKMSFSPLCNDLRRDLLEVYRDDIRGLEALLGAHLGIWYDQ